MLTKSARIIDLDDENIFIQVADVETCGTCRSCAKGFLKKTAYKFDKKEGVCEGDDVTLEINPVALLKVASLLYLLPIVFMVIFPAIMHLLLVSTERESTNAFMIMVSLLGLSAGFIIAKKVAKKMTGHYLMREVNVINN